MIAAAAAWHWPMILKRDALKWQTGVSVRVCNASKLTVWAR
jgi:hypothetical protein